jgi:hypothetical protein
LFLFISGDLPKPHLSQWYWILLECYFPEPQCASSFQNSNFPEILHGNLMHVNSIPWKLARKHDKTGQ